MVDRIITKDVYEICGLTDDYENSNLYRGEIIAPVTGRALKINDITFSKYKATVNTTIMEEDIRGDVASRIWNQFTEPRFITNHYWRGLEDKIAYQLAVVDNTECIRLFVDDVEVPVDEESLAFIPGNQRHSDNVIEKYYSCAIEFEGFDYENAQKG